MDTLVLNMEGKITAENTPAFEEELLKQADSAKPENVVIDMERLEYISSAGLRLILKLRKMFPTLSLVNVSDQIYGILSTTGFTHLVDIKKAYRQISLEGLPVLGEGVTATVYRLDQERVVKIFKEEISEGDLLREQKETRSAFIMGIPTMIAFETVRAGSRLGTVYEAFNSDTLVSIYKDAPAEKRRELISKYAATVRNMCSIRVNPDEFPSFREEKMRQFEAVKAKLAPDTGAALEKMLEAIPDDTYFAHGDCHMGNFMMDSDGNLNVIDLGISGYGNPIFSLTAVCFYRQFTELLPEDVYKERTGLSFREGKEIFHQFAAAYFHEAEEKEVGKIEQAVYLYSCLFSALIFTGMLISDEMFRVLTDRVKKALDQGFDTSIVFQYLKEQESD